MGTENKFLRAAMDTSKPFTMTEYIKANGLGVSPNDAAATRIIAEHLRGKGFVQRRFRKAGVAQTFWVRPDKRLATLRGKLKNLDEMWVVGQCRECTAINRHEPNCSKYRG